ncbi:MAG TPA: NUDIX domain-containing protein [Desulfomonilia bacterium]|nr:NUDIX domain-containing protein [Desulfomonilia bacterium]
MKYCPLCGKGLVSRETDGRQRIACPSEKCSYVFWDNPAPVVAAIVELDHSVVLVRNRLWPEKMFGLVTGFLERGETPETAVIREVREELGLDGTIAGFIGYYSFFEMNQLILAFHVIAQGTPVIGEELAEVRYVSPDRLKPWPFGTGHAVRDWLEKRTA